MQSKLIIRKTCYSKAKPSGRFHVFLLESEITWSPKVSPRCYFAKQLQSTEMQYLELMGWQGLWVNTTKSRHEREW